MEIIVITAVPLIMWWIAFAILVARDKTRHSGSLAAIPEPQPDALPHPSHSPRALSWPTRADEINQPTLLLTVPWCVLIQGVAVYGSGRLFFSTASEVMGLDDRPCGRRRFRPGRNRK
jgi:hypothetical protein